MRILTYCDTDAGSIEQRLGMPDYSYHFVQAAFHTSLVRFADVQRIQAPEEANGVWRSCHERDEACILLSFTPPHRTPLGLECPTLTVFAWEYPDLPAAEDEASWASDPRFTWRDVLLRTAGAITLSTHTAEAMRRELAADYPVLEVPTPLWEAFCAERARGPLPPDRAAVDICMEAIVVDSNTLGLSADNLLIDHPEDGTPTDAKADALLPHLPLARTDAWNADMGKDALPIRPHLIPEGLPEGVPPRAAGWELPPPFRVRTTLRGVVYTAVITPSDGRKNWENLLTAFAWAFRDVEDATLLLKLGGPNPLEHHCQMLMWLTKMTPMKCRVVAIHGYLDQHAYGQLIGASTYYVNASLCEGLCMPLLEFLCSGIPAIAPDHTAMADYINADLAFVVDSRPGVPALWPHGDLLVYHTHRNEVDWYSLMQAFRSSYRVARHDPEAYARMSKRATEAMHNYCGIDVVTKQLQPFLTARAREWSSELARDNSTRVSA